MTTNIYFRHLARSKWNDNTNTNRDPFTNLLFVLHYKCVDPLLWTLDESWREYYIDINTCCYSYLSFFFIYQLCVAHQERRGHGNAGPRHQNVRGRCPQDTRASRPGEALVSTLNMSLSFATPDLFYLFLQLSSLDAALCPVFMDVVLKNQPEGVKLVVNEVSS